MGGSTHPDGASRQFFGDEEWARGLPVIGVLVVDDHEVVRLGIAELFACVEGFTVVGTAADGSEAAATVQRLMPDVVLMDISMPGMDGIAATAAVLAVRPQVRVVILSGAVTGPLVRGAHAAGVAGYQLKSADPDDLIEAVRVVAAGRDAWCPQAVQALGGIR
ncbi:MAG: response regulator [Pseudonocardiaceae bacterium]